MARLHRVEAYILDLSDDMIEDSTEDIIERIDDKISRLGIHIEGFNTSSIDIHWYDNIDINQKTSDVNTYRKYFEKGDNND